jgi:hypothetical protein
MSTNLVHVLTVIGKAAGEVEVACEELLGRRVEFDPNCYGSEDWSESDHRAIADFCSSLINAATDLPVIYYARFLDTWTVADSRFWLLEWPDGRRRQVCGESFGFAFYPSEFSQGLLAQIRAFRRRKLYRNQSEDRWFLDQMREALHSALWLEARFLVVEISQCLGASRHDDEIRAALNWSIEQTSPDCKRGTPSRRVSAALDWSIGLTNRGT